MKKSLLKALSIVLVLIMAVSFAAVSAEDIPDVELLNVKDAELTVGPIVQGTGSVILLGSQKEASATFAGALVGNTSGNVNLNVGDGGFSYTIEYIYSDGTMTSENSEVKGVAASGTNADGYSVYNHDFDITLDANKPGDFIFRFKRFDVGVNAFADREGGDWSDVKGDFWRNAFGHANTATTTNYTVTFVFDHEGTDTYTDNVSLLNVDLFSKVEGLVSHRQLNPDIPWQVNIDGIWQNFDLYEGLFFPENLADENNIIRLKPADIGVGGGEGGETPGGGQTPEGGETPGGGQTPEGGETPEGDQNPEEQGTVYMNIYFMRHDPVDGVEQAQIQADADGRTFNELIEEQLGMPDSMLGFKEWDIKGTRLKGDDVAVAGTYEIYADYYNDYVRAKISFLDSEGNSITRYETVMGEDLTWDEAIELIKPLLREEEANAYKGFKEWNFRIYYGTGAGDVDVYKDPVIDAFAVYESYPDLTLKYSYIEDGEIVTKTTSVPINNGDFLPDKFDSLGIEDGGIGWSIAPEQNYASYDCSISEVWAMREYEGMTSGFVYLHYVNEDLEFHREIIPMYANGNWNRDHDLEIRFAELAYEYDMNHGLSKADLCPINYRPDGSFRPAKSTSQIGYGYNITAQYEKTAVCLIYPDGTVSRFAIDNFNVIELDTTYNGKDITWDGPFENGQCIAQTPYMELRARYTDGSFTVIYRYDYIKDGERASEVVYKIFPQEPTHDEIFNYFYEEIAPSLPHSAETELSGWHTEIHDHNQAFMELMFVADYSQGEYNGPTEVLYELYYATNEHPDHQEYINTTFPQPVDEEFAIDYFHNEIAPNISHTDEMNHIGWNIETVYLSPESIHFVIYATYESPENNDNTPEDIVIDIIEGETGNQALIPDDSFIQAVEDAYFDEDGAIIVPIDLSKHENVTEISFTKESLQLLTDAAKDVEEEVKLLIDLGQVTVTVSMEALEAVNETEGNKILSVVVDNDYNKLSKLQQDALKGKDLKLVISAFWTNENGEFISDFKGGDITLAINDFKPEKGKKLEDYTIVYVSDKGEIEIMPTFVDGQILCFVTGHFSDFVIMTKADAQALANPNPNTSDQVPVTFLVLVLALASATALAVLKKRYN